MIIDNSLIFYEKNTLGKYEWIRHAGTDTGKMYRSILSDAFSQGVGILPEKIFTHKDVVAAKTRAELMKSKTKNLLVHINYIYEHDKKHIHSDLCLYSNLKGHIDNLKSRLVNIGKVIIVCAYLDSSEILILNDVETGFIPEMPRYAAIKKQKANTDDYSIEKIKKDAEEADKIMESFYANQKELK